MGAFKHILFCGLVFGIFVSCKNPVPSGDPSSTVYIEQTENGYQLVRNNKPFHINGGASSPVYLEELKQAGANTARIYDTINLQHTLDKAEELDLAVAVDIPMPKYRNDPEFYENQELFDEMKERIEALIRRHKDHPALLYWNLGNELYYPYLYKRTQFFSNFNSLIDLIHEIDPNHPVSTITIGANKLRVLSIINKSPDLDFISFNTFGTLSSFSRKLKPIAPIWDGPYVITEWGINGPWEAKQTSWKVPIEETSTKKAEHIRDRYRSYMKPLEDKSSLGSFVFYWGEKNESTPTWFSLFGKEELKTQAVFELNNIWKNKDSIYPGPELDYLLLNGQGAPEDIVLPPNAKVEAEVVLPDRNNTKALDYDWEIRYESWHNTYEDILITDVNFEKEEKRVTFTTPQKEGPYRVHLYLTNETDYFATANIPFYVLNPANEE